MNKWTVKQSISNVLLYNFGELGKTLFLFLKETKELPSEDQ